MTTCSFDSWRSFPFGLGPHLLLAQNSSGHPPLQHFYLLSRIIFYFQKVIVVLFVNIAYMNRCTQYTQKIKNSMTWGAKAKGKRYLHCGRIKNGVDVAFQQATRLAGRRRRQERKKQKRQHTRPLTMENTYGMELLANGGPPQDQQGYPGDASRSQPIHLARYPPSYGHQQFQQQQYQQHQQQYPGYHQQQQQQYYYQQQQQQQQQYLQQMQMSSSPEYNALRGSSPVSSGGANRSGSPPQCGHSPRGGWSSETDSSGFSSPPSDAGGRGGDEWDLLSDMLIEDALASAPVPPSSVISSSSNSQQGLYKQPSQYMTMPSHYQFSQQQQTPMMSSSLLPVAPNSSSESRSHASVSSHLIQKNVQTPPSAALVPSSPSQDAVSTSPALAGSQSIQPANISPVQRARANTKRAAAASTAAAAAVPMKVEPVSTEEQKKLRRRTQIATSVQRHREKKKVCKPLITLPMKVN